MTKWYKLVYWNGNECCRGGGRAVKDCCVENRKGRLEVEHCAYVKQENSVKTNNE